MIRHNRYAAGLLGLTLLLGGCSLTDSRLSGTTEQHCVTHGIPSLVDDECLLPTWVAFGRTAQTGSAQWRDEVLHYMQDDSPRAGLVRALVYAYQQPAQWSQSVALLRRYSAEAPSSIQPLLQQWRHDVEQRIALNARLDEQQSRSSAGNSRQRGRIRELEAQNAELRRKLDALTAIEQSMNQR
ncbi:hypothetical protein [Kushneria aurantia]|uniref:YfhG lipoprotein n=1 Tax=Kushneria aurantia TaxID=504092 RepID=A0ABV6G337_9GAMM|nr:hypothetical protein [Kushneria aurantia]